MTKVVIGFMVWIALGWSLVANVRYQRRIETLETRLVDLRAREVAHGY